MLYTQLKESLKDAMRAKDAVKLSVIRGLLTACMNEMISKGKTPQDVPNDEEVLTVISRAVKQRKDSINQFVEGGRPELAESEKAELAILEAYLPAQMSEEEIKKVVDAKKAELNVTDKAQVGLFMKAVMTELKGKADGMLVKKVVDESFN